MKIYLKKLVFVLVIMFYLNILAFPVEALSNLIPNADLEQVATDSDQPENWLTNNWGDNQAKFIYPANSPNGRAVGVELTSWQSGDAKWYFTPLLVKPATNYIFSDSYQSDVETSIVVMSQDASGQVTYFDLAERVVAAPNGWRSQSYQFQTLPSTETLTIFHLIKEVGYLRTDNFNLAEVLDTPLLDHLINNSVETISSVDSHQPENWQNNQWGEISAAFNYDNVGYQSDKSLAITVTHYGSGDAKWYFSPISLLTETDYIYSDYYQSDVPTRVVALSQDNQGKQTYFDLSENVAPSPGVWKKLSLPFRTLPETKTLTIFHLIDQVGYLKTDNFNLTLNQKQTSDFIPNHSLETVSLNDESFPEDWFPSAWGENTPTYQYLNDGHDGKRSIKLTMTNYISGDAKWDYTPQILQNGQDYQFSAWYKTDTIPHVAVKYTTTTNIEKYFGLPDPIAEGNDWQEYRAVFNVPKNTKNVSVFFFLTNNGFVQTDEYKITPYHYQGFDRPIVTLTFDDGFEQNVKTALPILANYGFKTTHCYTTKYLKGLPEQMANLVKITASGHEACSHSVNHLDLSQEETAVVDTELIDSKDFIESLTKKPVTTFSTPYGAYNKNVLAEIEKYYQAHRTTDEGYNSKDNLNPQRLMVQNMTPTTTLSQFKQWVNKAKRDKTWLILIYHAVVASPNPLSEYDTRKSDFQAQMAYLASTQVAVERLDQALIEVSQQ